MFQEYIEECDRLRKERWQKTLDELQYQAEQRKPSVLKFINKVVPEFYQKFEIELANAEPTYLNVNEDDYFSEPGVLLGGLVFTHVDWEGSEKLIVSKRVEGSEPDKILDIYLVTSRSSTQTFDIHLVTVLRKCSQGENDE